MNYYESVQNHKVRTVGEKVWGFQSTGTTRPLVSMALVPPDRAPDFSRVLIDDDDHQSLGQV